MRPVRAFPKTAHGGTHETTVRHGGHRVNDHCFAAGCIIRERCGGADRTPGGKLRDGASPSRSMRGAQQPGR